MNRKYLITSALPYANGTLHFGHLAGACLPADIQARYRRFVGHEVLFVSGSDEYGVAITMSAEQEGRTAKQQADHYHHKNSELFKQLDFSFDHYSRTTSALHAGPVTQFFEDLRKNGFVEQRLSDQLYSESEGRFLSDRYVEGICPSCDFKNARGDECPRCGASFEAIDLLNPRAKSTKTALTRKKTLHWYLRLDLFKDRLSQWLVEKEWKPNVLHFAASYIRDLKPRSITRDSNWGIEVPDKEMTQDSPLRKVFYVWFDAPIGYLTASIEWAQQIGEPDRWKDYWLSESTRFMQFLGKDNIPFHAAIFPAMTMGQNQPLKLVDDLIANEFYHLEGRKLSKSEGWSVDLKEFLTRYSADQLRYYLAATAPENGDSEFTWADFQVRCNAELVGKLGNFVHRTLSFLHSHMEGKVPEALFNEGDRAALDHSHHLLDQLKKTYASCQLRKTTQLIMELAQWGNIYFDAQKPWVLARQSQFNQLKTALYCCLEMIRHLAIAIYPLIPSTAEAIWKQLGYKDLLSSRIWSDWIAQPLTANQICQRPQLLFEKIEDAAVLEEIAKLKQGLSKKEDALLKSEEPTKQKQMLEQIDFDAFKALDFRVGQITGAERIEKSRKLLCLQVNLGDHERQIVAGLAKNFIPEDLIGKKVAVLTNLKPAAILGVKSEGMLLAATSNDLLHPLDPGDLPNGSLIS